MTKLTHVSTLGELAQWGLVKTGADLLLVTRVTKDRQFIVAHCGLQLPEHLGTDTHLDYSICQHVVAMNFPLIVDDAYTHPLLRGSLAVHELGLAAYAGAPVHDDANLATGAFCAMYARSHRWTREQIRVILSGAKKATELLGARRLN